MRSVSSNKSDFMSCTCTSSEDVTTIDLESIQTAKEPEEEKRIISSLPQYSIDFGTVNIGSTVKQVVRLQNLRATDVSCYALIKDAKSNPIFQAFDFDNTDYPKNVSKSLEKVVSFHPKIPNEKCLDHFYLTQDGVTIAVILLKGQCAGPRAQISTTSIRFTKCKERQAIEILNTSEMQLTYQFDVNGTDYDIFQVDNPFGTVDSKKRKIVYISFNPKARGIYSKYLSCLILHENPKILKLLGIYLSDQSQLTELKPYPRQLSEETGFSGFMSDSLTLLKNIPPFSLSQNFLDFGMVEANGSIVNRKTMVTSLTNHMNSPITVMWIDHEYFKISPKKIQIPSEESVLYEVTFTPTVCDSLFYADLIGTVLWSEEKPAKTATLVPQSISLRLLGNSFFDNKPWVPQLEMAPESVIYPCCVPGIPSYTSFILRATGYLPVSFRFVPPDRSNFVIKPMVGIVSRYQIICAQFHPLSAQGKGYVERWEIQLNGRTEGHGFTFFMKGYSENPVILLGNDDTVTFSTMLPGAKEKETVSLKNMTAHFLQYQFLLSPEEPRHAHLDTTHKVGELAANESAMIEWTCTGSLNMPKEVKVPYAMRFLQSASVVVGTEFLGRIKVRASCAEAKLCSAPHQMAFGDVQYECKETTMFKLFNFGKSALHFLLLNDDEHSDIDISPTQGTIKPDNNMVINIVLSPKHTGKSKINIYYNLRAFNDSAELLTSTKCKIFEVTYVSKLSCMQISAIEYHDHEILFNQLLLWNLMNIDHLNDTLRTITAGETREIDIYLPENREMLNETLKVYFTLKNVSEFDMNISIVRKQICKCKAVEKTVGLSRRRIGYDCIHREMVRIDIENNYLKPQSSTAMIIRCTYSTPGKNALCYVLKLPNSRNVILNIHIRTLGPSEHVLSFYKRSIGFRLRDTYVGELDPCLQTYWVYNNTSKTMEYYLDLSEVNDLEYKSRFPIIECTNPMGYIVPSKAYPLIFKFSPIEAVTYGVSVPIIVDQETMFVLKVTGKGVLYPKRVERKTRHPFQRSIVHNAIVTSAEHISLPLIGLWTEIDRVFYIKNYSNEVTYYYSWQHCGIIGLIDVHFDRPKGVIKPKETHTVRVVVNSLQNACVTTVQLLCKFISQNAYIEHTRTLAEHRLMQEKLDTEFVITELGEQPQENTVVIAPMPGASTLNMSMDIYIIGTQDRDFHMDAKSQMEKFPETFVRLKTKRVSSLLKGNGAFDRNLSGTSLHHNDVAQTTGLVQSVLQMIVGDVIYSKLFRHIIFQQKYSCPPYHYQMRHTYEKDNNTRRDSGASSEVQSVKDSPNQLLRYVTGDLILNSMRVVFQLGTESSQINDCPSDEDDQDEDDMDYKCDDNKDLLLNVKQKCVCLMADKDKLEVKFSTATHR